MQPQYSAFPVDEYVSRYQRAQRLMEKSGIDALLLTSKENVIYFSGLETVGWDSKHRPLGVILPAAKHMPVLVIPETLAAVAQATSWVTEVRLWGGWKRPDAAKDPITGIISALSDLDLATKLIGMELGYGQRVAMSQVDMQALMAGLREAQVVDAADLLWELRMVKSPREIEVLRKVCLATCEVYRIGFESAREGMTERELAGVMLAEMARQTHYRPGFTGIRAGRTKYGMMNVPPFDLRMEKGDLVVVDAGATLKDYWCDMMRMMCIGKPSDDQRRFFDCELEAQMAGVETIKPGAVASDVCQAALTVIERRGLRQHAPALERVGHGLGLEVHEPPSLALDNARVLEPGMVLCVEPIFSDLPDCQIGNFALEDVVLVTATGREILTPFPKELYVVSR